MLRMGGFLLLLCLALGALTTGDKKSWSQWSFTVDLPGTGNGLQMVGGRTW